MTQVISTVHEAKAAAKALRASLADSGEPISHSQALEQVSHQHGFRDWNAFCAQLEDLPPAAWVVGGRVSGRFRGQQFEGVLLSLSRRQPGWFEVSLKLDEAVDVVTFDSFSNLRQRIMGVIGPEGRSRERTSDGEPHLVLNT